MSAENTGITKTLIWKVCGILAVITIVEIAVALMFGSVIPKPIMTTFFVLLSLLKAFYIVSIFMHMKYEVRSFVYISLLPLVLLIWFIIALVYEGGSWLVMRGW